MKTCFYIGAMCTFSYMDSYMVTITRQGYGNITDKNSIMLINPDAYVAPFLKL